MFSGIIIELGSVASMEGLQKGGAVLTVSAPTIADRAVIGDSVSVNGVCLTVTEVAAGGLRFDLSEETLRVTGLGALEEGERVNLEPSLRVGDSLGGHFVSGHVDAVGEIVEKRAEGDCSIIKFRTERKITDLIVDRGSIAVDGISLTVTKTGVDLFEVVIIPHTALMTTLGAKGPGDKVNLESDMIGKYVAKLVRKDAAGGEGIDVV